MPKKIISLSTKIPTKLPDPVPLNMRVRFEPVAHRHGIMDLWERYAVYVKQEGQAEKPSAEPYTFLYANIPTSIDAIGEWSSLATMCIFDHVRYGFARHAKAVIIAPNVTQCTVFEKPIGGRLLAPKGFYETGFAKVVNQHLILDNSNLGQVLNRCLRALNQGINAPRSDFSDLSYEMHLSMSTHMVPIHMDGKLYQVPLSLETIESAWDLMMATVTQMSEGQKGIVVAKNRLEQAVAEYVIHNLMPDCVLVDIEIADTLGKGIAIPAQTLESERIAYVIFKKVKPDSFDSPANFENHEPISPSTQVARARVFCILNENGKQLVEPGIVNQANFKPPYTYDVVLDSGMAVEGVPHTHIRYSDMSFFRRLLLEFAVDYFRGKWSGLNYYEIGFGGGEVYDALKEIAPMCTYKGVDISGPDVMIKRRMAKNLGHETKDVFFDASASIFDYGAPIDIAIWQSPWFMFDRNFVPGRVEVEEGSAREKGALKVEEGLPEVEEGTPPYFPVTASDGRQLYTRLSPSNDADVTDILKNTVSQLKTGGILIVTTRQFVDQAAMIDLVKRKFSDSLNIVENRPLTLISHEQIPDEELADAFKFIQSQNMGLILLEKR